MRSVGKWWLNGRQMSTLKNVSKKKIATSDITIDLIFLEKSSLYHHSIVLGVLTLSKHTDWFRARKFWINVEENPNITLKDHFIFI
ncbi:unnamed protein product [Rotaria sordida]|uniref:Uncharacterized protein n=1 Tax=Rotaria sordida TaxID=392033 RepID=A0A815J3G3_9BILA|nr:unnamed protein product [Rotaria sordida]CAF1612949.1 unnamed protein product [Rotaria sordida]